MNSGTRAFDLEFAEAARLVVTRCHNICERCHCRKVEHVHHKRGRRPRAGANDLDNLLGVCFNCHREIHDNPGDSYEKGWMIRRGL